MKGAGGVRVDYFRLTSGNADEVVAFRFVRFDVTIRQMMFVSLQSHVSVFLVNESN